jgi:hypothetical protein
MVQEVGSDFQLNFPRETDMGPAASTLVLNFSGQKSENTFKQKRARPSAKCALRFRRIFQLQGVWGHSLVMARVRQNGEILFNKFSNR